MLELQPQREFQDAGIERTCYLSVVRVAQGRIRVAGIRMVERVERLGAEFNEVLLREVELLKQGHVELLLAWPADDAGLGVAVVAMRGIHKGCGVEPLLS